MYIFAVSGSWDTTLHIWNQTNGQLIQVLRGHGDSVYALAVLNDELVASGSRDTTIIIFTSVSAVKSKNIPSNFKYKDISNYCIEISL